MATLLHGRIMFDVVLPRRLVGFDKLTQCLERDIKRSIQCEVLEVGTGDIIIFPNKCAQERIGVNNVCLYAPPTGSEGQLGQCRAVAQQFCDVLLESLRSRAKGPGYSAIA